jgi:chromate transporter
MMCLTLFLTFLKIGAFTFGGGYAMLPLIQESVLGNGWLGAQELVNFIAVSESTPGPFAVNIATYVGRQMSGIPGAVSATLGVVLPSFVIILIIARFFEKFKNSKIVKGIMSGLKPAVIGLIGAAVISVAQTAFFPNGFSIKEISGYSFISAVIIFAIAAFLTFKKKLHPILIILICAGMGIAAGYAQVLF